MDLALSGYREALDLLFARTTGASKLGLERTRDLLADLGDPHRRTPVLHVAGTNGKGSVCATLDALLRPDHARVGRYTSPHLVDFRERVLVNGRPMPETEVVAFIERQLPAIDRIGATFFEATTAMALDWFARAGCDVVVVETGLGGRLDSTNVVDPVSATVTAIGIDHVEYLGDTLELIAAEKAGIFKRGAAALVGERDPRVREQLLAAAQAAGASPIVALEEDWRVSDVAVDALGTSFTLAIAGGRQALRTPLVGRHQAYNAALAVATVASLPGALRIAPDTAGARLANVHLPGRFDRRGRWLFDVAHNPDGAATVAETLAAVAPARPVVALLTVLRDKDWRGIMSALATQVDHFILTEAPTAPASRAWSSGEAGAYAHACGWSAEVENDFELAVARAAACGETVLVTGSFHTVGDAMSVLQVDPLAG